MHPVFLHPSIPNKPSSAQSSISAAHLPPHNSRPLTTIHAPRAKCPQPVPHATLLSQKVHTHVLHPIFAGSLVSYGMMHLLTYLCIDSSLVRHAKRCTDGGCIYLYSHPYTHLYIYTYICLCIYIYRHPALACNFTKIGKTYNKLIAKFQDRSPVSDRKAAKRVRWRRRGVILCGRDAGGVREGVGGVSVCLIFMFLFVYMYIYYGVGEYITC
jgi:hypothetical protein